MLIYVKLEPLDSRKTEGHIGSAWPPYSCYMKLLKILSLGLQGYLYLQRCKQPTRCNKFLLLIFLNQLYMFRATNSPILRSTFWLYIQSKTCRADLKRSINGICCILLVEYIVVLIMHGLINIKKIYLYSVLTAYSKPIVDEWKTNLMTLATLFHLLWAQHASDINISIFRSLRLCWWITTSVVLFSDRCVLEFLLRLVFGGVRFAGWSRLQLLRQRNKYINLNILTYCSELVFIQKRTWFCKMQVKLKAVFSRTQFLPLILRFPYFRWMGRWIFLHAYPSVR